MRNPFSYILCLFLGSGLLAGAAEAQFKNGSQPTELNIPRVSQRGAVTQRIGLTDINISYHRPTVGGREIWDKVVPYGKVWRGGGDEKTTLQFADEGSGGGKPRAAGAARVGRNPRTGEKD